MNCCFQDMSRRQRQLHFTTLWQFLRASLLFEFFFKFCVRTFTCYSVNCPTTDNCFRYIYSRWTSSLTELLFNFAKVIWECNFLDCELMSYIVIWCNHKIFTTLTIKFTDTLIVKNSLCSFLTLWVQVWPDCQLSLLRKQSIYTVKFAAITLWWKVEQKYS